MHKRNANIILYLINMLQTFLSLCKNISYFFIPDFFHALYDEIILEYSLFVQRKSRISSPRLVYEPVQWPDITIARRAFWRFRASRDDAAVQSFRIAIGTEGYSGLDGSIVIKSIGSYYRFAVALVCSMDLIPYTPYLGMGPIEASTIRMHYGAQERTCR